jgi:hypothetical protein
MPQLRTAEEQQPERQKTEPFAHQQLKGMVSFLSLIQRLGSPFCTLRNGPRIPDLSGQYQHNNDDVSPAQTHSECSFRPHFRDLLARRV